MLTLFAAMAMAGTIPAGAQTNIANYRFAQSTGTYTPITGGTVFIAASTPFDQEKSSAISIPAMTFGGATVSAVYVHANGYLTFGAVAGNTDYTPLSTSITDVTGVIAGFAADLGYSNGNATTGAASEIRYQQVGDEFVAQYTDVKRWNVANERISFQIRVNSTTGVISIVYGGTIVAGSSTTALQVGIRGNSNTWSSNVNSLKLLNVPAATTCNWNDAVTSNSNSETMYFSSGNTNALPSSGLTYTWTPASAPAPVRTFSAVTNITGNSATMNWTAPTGATQYNVQYRIPGTCAWTNFSGNPVSAATATITGLAPLTTYQVRVQSVAGANTSIWSHIPSSSGTGDGYSTTGTFKTTATCVPPTALAVPAATLSSTSAVINWTAPTYGPPTAYNWEIRTSGAAGSGPTGLAFSGTTSNTTINPTTLASATAYSVYVRTSCSATDSSVWTSGVNFTTMCATPAPGATIASITNNMCAGTNVAFSLTNATPGPGVTYQWQTSNDNTTYTNISGATSATYTGAALAKYYRCMVKCSAGPDSTASGPVTLNFVNSVTSATGNQRCGNGTVDLTATGSAGSTLKWYSAISGGFSLGTGSPFTTPAINSTTQYFVGAETVSTGTIPVGAGVSTGTAVAYNPTQGGYGGLKGQYLFTALDLVNAGLSAGNITALALDITSTGSTLNGFTIQIGTTPLTDLPTPVSILTTPNTVYPAANFTPVVGVNTFTFATPYNWDGVSNIVVSISWSNNNSSNNSSTVRYDATTNYASQTYRKDNETSANMLAFTGGTATGTYTFDRTQNRPKMIFSGQAVCSGPRIPVTATVNTAPAFAITPNQTVCNTAVTTLTVTSPAANYNNVVWSPATNLYTNAAATTAYTAGSNASTVYLKSTTPGKVVYTATANNTTTSCGAITTDTITILPGTVTAEASPGTLCYTGTSVLALVPATGYGAATFQWQSSMNNTTFVDTNGTGTTYTTPTLTSTRYYRAVIKNSAGAVCMSSVPDTVLVNTPAITGSTPATRCGPGSVNLSATANTGSVVKWYAAATGGTALATGATFATPSISANTNYWAEASTAGGFALVGPASPTAQGGTQGTQTVGWDVNFTVLANTTLNTVDIFPLASGESGVIRVQTGNGFGGTVLATINYTTSVSGGATAQTITINTPLTPGTYSLYTSTLPGSGLKRNTSGATYPYTSSVANITGNGYDNTYFMGMYNWNFAASCTSPRVSVAATVNPLPTVTVSPNGNVPICAGATTTLTATGTGSLQWKNASGNINGQTNATFTTGNAGTYKVVITNPTTGCYDSSAAINVTVNPLPVVNLGNDTTFCSGNTLTLNAGNPGSTYLWNDNSTNVTKAVTASGTYAVKVTTSSNCSKSDTINVTVNPTPVVHLGNDTNLCTGVNYVLNAGNPGAAYLWDNASTAQTRTINATGTYHVKVTNAFNCAARDTIVATYLPTPVVNLGADRDVCAGASVTLDAGNPTETFLWDNGSTGQTRTVNASGTYHVTVSNVAHCKASDTVTVMVHPLPVVNLGNDTVICHGNTLTLDARNPGASYRWNDNSTNQTLPVTATGNYSVVVTDVFSCVGTDNINVLVKDPPSGNINAVYSNNATYVFNVLNARYVSNYTWDFGDGSARVTGGVVEHQYARNGIYTVTVMLAGECNDSLGRSRTVDVFDAAGGTGIPQIKDSKELLLYPNPARDIVTLENKHNLKMKHITVYNVVGQIISDGKADTEDKHILHTQAYAPGIYTIRIETGKGFVLRKFEIMK